jgi:RNA polymerase sigma-54 factor
LREHLLGQLALTRASRRDVILVGMLIDELDENGYLGSPLEEILQWLPPEVEADEDELRAALSLLQSFDPPGIGARDVAECLLLQLRRPDFACLAAAGTGMAAALACARSLCADHLTLLAGGNVARLRETLQCDEATLRAARTLIQKLDPRPGRAWTVAAADYAVPDVIVRKARKGWHVLLNSAAMPRLRVNGLYAQLLSNQRESSHAGLQTQLQQARWMIRNVEQRFDTILRVSQAIVNHQSAFFSQGPAAMRPLILKDIASEVGLHESTVSRATTQKYMLTPFGTLELKHFFGAGVATDSGDAASATAVQSFIRQMVADENRAKPLSDNQLMLKLAERGIVIARRTVAKYREALRIAPASVRKAQAALR